MAYQTHHGTKQAHLNRVFIPVCQRLHTHRETLVSLIDTYDPKAYRRLHPSQDLESWSYRFNRVIGINKDPRHERGLKRYHPNAEFRRGDAIKHIAECAEDGISGLYYLDLMCQFQTISKGCNQQRLDRFFKAAPSDTVIIINCMVYAGIRQKGETSDVPLRYRKSLARMFKKTFRYALTSRGWQYVKDDYYNSDSRVRTPMLSLIFHKP
jgi:hypothetical protein